MTIIAVFIVAMECNEEVVEGSIGIIVVCIEEMIGSKVNQAL